MSDSQDAYGNDYIAQNTVYEHYLTQNTTDTGTLKKDMTVSSHDISEAILNISRMSNMSGHGNYAAGGSISVPPGGSYSMPPGQIVYSGGHYSILPNANWTESYPPFNAEALAEKIVTRYVPGNPLVICLDDDFTTEQVNEITGQLIRHNIEAVLIRGARAGTGRPQGTHYTNAPDEGKRIDILARLAETWERHPDLTFAELIRWWNGENMTDDDFAAATDVYAKKVYE